VTARAAALPEVLVLGPDASLFKDHRGSFREVWHAERHAALGVRERFVQDNVSISRTRVLRGLHAQHPRSQGKLVSVLQGAVFDVAVDIRLGSPTFGQWTAETLTAADGRQMYVPAGFAHGFLVVSAEDAVVLYKCTEHYALGDDFAVAWNDPGIGVEWPVQAPILSERDARAPALADLPESRLPVYRAL
jgi:dTDP-4-dehydrorhamnose 3,5-epimerase